VKPLQQMTDAELIRALRQATRRADQLWEMGKPNEEIEKVLAWEYRLQVALGILDT
jgi:hypothetical protein